MNKTSFFLFNDQMNKLRRLEEKIKEIQDNLSPNITYTPSYTNQG